MTVSQICLSTALHSSETKEDEVHLYQDKELKTSITTTHKANFFLISRSIANVCSPRDLIKSHMYEIKYYSMYECFYDEHLRFFLGCIYCTINARLPLSGLPRVLLLLSHENCYKQQLLISVIYRNRWLNIVAVDYGFVRIVVAVAVGASGAGEDAFPQS